MYLHGPDGNLRKSDVHGFERERERDKKTSKDHPDGQESGERRTLQSGEFQGYTLTISGTVDKDSL